MTLITNNYVTFPIFLNLSNVFYDTINTEIKYVKTTTCCERSLAVELRNKSPKRETNSARVDSFQI